MPHVEGQSSRPEGARIRFVERFTLGRERRSFKKANHEEVLDSTPQQRERSRRRDISSNHPQQEPIQKREPLVQRETYALFSDVLKGFSEAPHPVEPIQDGRKKTEHIKRLWREIATGDKVHREIAITVLSGVLFPVGPLIIGGLNLVNAGIEVKDVIQGKGNMKSLVRAALYTLCSGFEFGLLLGGQFVGSALTGVVEQLVGLVLPGVVERTVGVIATGAFGSVTGLVTNSTVWEIMREKNEKLRRYNAIVAMKTNADQPEKREEMQSVVTGIVADVATVRRNIELYLTGNEHGTELSQLEKLRESVSHRSRNPFLKIFKGYYDREIELEEIKRNTAQEVLTLLHTLYPEESL